MKTFGFSEDDDEITAPLSITILAKPYRQHPNERECHERLRGIQIVSGSGHGTGGVPCILPDVRVPSSSSSPMNNRPFQCVEQLFKLFVLLGEARCASYWV